MNRFTGRIIIYGGRGSLGSACVNHFKSRDWWIINIDYNPQHNADLNIIVPRNASMRLQETMIIDKLKTILQGNKVHAIICAAGSYTHGNAAQNLVKNTEEMWESCVFTSAISASLATKYLTKNGLLALTGAHIALSGTPSMIGFGLSKAAVHQLTRSLAERGSGLPKDATTLAILPELLDTPENREKLSHEECSTLTPVSLVSSLMMRWVHGIDRPPSGSLVSLVTRDNQTTVDINRPPTDVDEEIPDS